MAGFDVDTSVYPRANPNALTDSANQFLGIANAAQQNQLLQTANQQTHQDLVKGQVSYLANGLGALASKADLSANDMHTFAQRAVQEGIISPETYQAESAAVDAAGNDPVKLRALATNYALRALSAGEQFNAQFGTPSIINQGNTQTPVTVSPLTGIHPIGAPIQNTLTPQDIAATAPIGVNSNNQVVSGTKGQQLTQLGVNPLTAQPDAAPAAPANALLPSPATADGGSANAAPVPLAPLPSGPQGIVTAPAPGAAEAQTEVAGNSAKQYSSDLAQAANYQQATLPLQKAIPALEALGTTGTGPGTEQLNQIGSFLQSMGVPGIDPTGIKNYDEAKKYLTQYVNMTGNVGTNDKLAASFAGNPSTEISNAAAVDVAKTALSLSRLQNAQVRAFAATGQPSQTYSQFAKDFNANQDPRAYGLDLMDPAQRAKLIGSLKGAERTKFAQSLRNAMTLGLVSPPGGANAQ